MLFIVNAICVAVYVALAYACGAHGWQLALIAVVGMRLEIFSDMLNGNAAAQAAIARSQRSEAQGANTQLARIARK